MQMKTVCAFFIICLFNLSCSHYIDSTVNKADTSNGIGLTAFDQYDLFSYNPTYTLRADHEVTTPISFEVKLPKKMRYYSGTNGSDFGFYYDKGQVIFIKTGIKNSNDNKETYEPTDKELNDLIQNELITSGGRFDIKDVVASPKNKSMIIRMNKIVILLYNINKENLNRYVSLVSTFKLK
jgi:hypothetical protein